MSFYIIKTAGDLIVRQMNFGVLPRARPNCSRQRQSHFLLLIPNKQPHTRSARRLRQLCEVPSTLVLIQEKHLTTELMTLKCLI